eukprot:1120658_1
MGNASTYVSNTRAKEQSNQYSQLICMGFDESISLKAATIHPTNINAAITYIASQSSSQTSSANDNNGSKSIDWPLNLPVYITIGHEAHQSGFTLTKEMYLKWKVVDVLRLLIEKMTEISEMQYRLMTPDHDQISKSFCDYTSDEHTNKCLTEFDTDHIISKGLHMHILREKQSSKTCCVIGL